MYGVGNVFVTSCLFFSLFLWHRTSSPPFHFYGWSEFVFAFVFPLLLRGISAFLFLLRLCIGVFMAEA
jgi:hypothetical protein